MTKRVWKTGDELIGQEWTITQDMVNRYATESGDHNPIHIDAEFAAKTQFGGRIAHGMLGAALLNTVLAQNLGALWNEGANVKFKFKAPIKPGESVFISGHFRDVSDDTALIDIDCRKLDNTVAISCIATIPKLSNLK